MISADRTRNPYAVVKGKAAEEFVPPGHGFWFSGEQPDDCHPLSGMERCLLCEAKMRRAHTVEAKPSVFDGFFHT